MDSLATYRSKRNFSKTTEPRGKIGKSFKGRFVIQKHAARRLHFDFRLEWKGVLKSWAVPKGPSLDPTDKRLAVQVEDHPLDYGDFEGTIPEGEYGGGAVMLWDKGSWEPVGDVEKALHKGHLEFHLRGARLRGRYHLIRLKAGEGHDKTNWLLVKGEDEYAKPGSGDWALSQDRSILSKRSMAEIGADKKSRAAADPGQAGETKPALLIAKAKSAPLPAFIPPQLALRAYQAPSADQWIHEMKFDGYRIGVRIRGKGKQKKVSLMTRSGLDWGKRFPSLVKSLAELACESAYLDGEIVVLNEKGVSDFSMLQDALSREDDSQTKCYLFDLLYLNGKDLRALPLVQRKALLLKLLPKESDRLEYSQHYEASGTDFYRAACELALEGIVSKNKNAPYASKRNGSWIKTKCSEQDEFVVGGYTQSKSGKGIGAFLVGHYEDGILTYDGRVGTGLSQRQAEVLEKKLARRKIRKAPFSGLRTMDKRKAIWVTPDLVIEAKYMGRSSDGLLRHASLIDMREDKPPKEVTKEDILSPGRMSNIVAGIKISNPDRSIDPSIGATKLELAQYYEKAAPLMLEEIALRPLSLIRCPDGIEGQKFFQRHPQIGLRQILDLTDPQDGEKLIAINDAKGLVNLVQFGAIEIHPWEGKVRDLSKADRMVFDLDPDPAIPYAELIKAAHDLKERLEKMGMVSLAKITGGKGIHVVVPLNPAIGWPLLKGVSRAIVRQMAKEEPDRFTSVMSKAKRRNKIFIDYLRNDRGSTAIGIFSARARPGLPIAMPLNWAELTPSLSPAHYSIRSKDLRLPGEWKEISRIKQRFTASILRSFHLKD